MYWQPLRDDLKHLPVAAPPSDWQGSPSFSSSLPYHLAQPLASTGIPFLLKSNKQGLIEREKGSESASIHVAPTVCSMTGLGCLFFPLFLQSGEEETQAQDKSLSGTNSTSILLSGALKAFTSVFIPRRAERGGGVVGNE